MISKARKVITPDKIFLFSILIKNIIQNKLSPTDLEVIFLQINSKRMKLKYIKNAEIISIKSAFLILKNSINTKF